MGAREAQEMSRDDNDTADTASLVRVLTALSVLTEAASGAEGGTSAGGPAPLSPGPAKLRETERSMAEWGILEIPAPHCGHKHGARISLPGHPLPRACECHE